MPAVHVTIAAFSTPLEAHLVRGRLEAEGVTVWVVNEQQIAVNELLSNALGGVRLEVPAEQAGRASALLAELAAGAFELADEDDRPRAHDDPDAAGPDRGRSGTSTG